MVAFCGSLLWQPSVATVAAGLRSLARRGHKHKHMHIGPSALRIRGFPAAAPGRFLTLVGHTPHAACLIACNWPVLVVFLRFSITHYRQFNYLGDPTTRTVQSGCSTCSWNELIQLTLCAILPSHEVLL